MDKENREKHGKQADKRQEAKKRKNKPRVKPMLERKITFFPKIHIASQLLRMTKRLYAYSRGDRERPKPLVLKKPLTARQALSLLDPRHLTCLSPIPVSWIALVKPPLSRLASRLHTITSRSTLKWRGRGLGGLGRQGGGSRGGAFCSS